MRDRVAHCDWLKLAQVRVRVARRSWLKTGQSGSLCLAQMRDRVAHWNWLIRGRVAHWLNIFVLLFSLNILSHWENNKKCLFSSWSPDWLSLCPLCFLWHCTVKSFCFMSVMLSAGPVVLLAPPPPQPPLSWLPIESQAKPGFLSYSHTHICEWGFSSFLKVRYRHHQRVPYVQYSM